VPIDPPPDDDVGPLDDDDKTVAQPERREIILHSRDNCPPCDSWWHNERPKFEADGWIVALHVLRPNENGRTPFFTIEANGKQIEHQGWLTLEKAKELGR
jgi:hypothetical protein